MGGGLALAQLGATGSFLLVMLWINLLIQHLQTEFQKRRETPRETPRRVQGRSVLCEQNVPRLKVLITSSAPLPCQVHWRLKGIHKNLD